MKKRVLIYIRVSTDEQKERGFSLKHQEEHLLNFCKLKNFDVLQIFSEDYTAWKGFERPAYNDLIKYISVNKSKIDYVIFTQWSRFSRDVAASYAEIERLRKLKIEPNAAEQWIDFSIPENQYMLAFYLAAPQVENDRLSLRTRAGMRQALKEGRWLWKAPFGYKNDKETKLIYPCEKMHR